MWRQLGAENLAVRQEHLTLLQAAVVALPDVAPDLAALATPGDPEADFFFNVAHLQLHRRARALNKLARRLREEPGALSLGSMTNAVVPLLHQAIVEGRAGEGASGGHAEKGASEQGGASSADGKEANVAEAAVGCLGAVAACLPWAQYRQLLARFMGAMRAATRAAGEDGAGRDGRGKAPIRAVCAILDAFHFLKEGGVVVATAVSSGESSIVLRLTASITPHRRLDFVSQPQSILYGPSRPLMFWGK